MTFATNDQLSWSFVAKVAYSYSWQNVPDLQWKSFYLFWKRQLILVCGIQDLHSGDLTDCIINKVSATPAHKVTARWPPVTDGAFLPVFPDFSEHEEVRMIFACMLMWNRNVMGETTWVWNITNLYCIENYDRLLFQVSIKLSRDFDWPRTSLTKPLYMKVKAHRF